MQRDTITNNDPIGIMNYVIIIRRKMTPVVFLWGSLFVFGPARVKLEVNIVKFGSKLDFKLNVDKNN